MLSQIHNQYVQKDVHKNQSTYITMVQLFDHNEQLANVMYKVSFEVQIHDKMVDVMVLIHILNNNFTKINRLF